MKNLFKVLVALVYLPIVAFAQDDISIDPGPIGNGRYLGAKTADSQTTVPVLGVDSTGDTEINALTGKTVNLSIAKTPVALASSTGFQSLKLASETVAGAGTTVADAGQLSATKVIHRVTGADGTVGVKMSASMLVDGVQIILNTTAGVLKIYAESGGTVNGGSADAAFSALTGIKPIICVKTAALTYICS